MSDKTEYQKCAVCGKDSEIEVWKLKRMCERMRTLPDHEDYGKDGFACWKCHAKQTADLITDEIMGMQIRGKTEEELEEIIELSDDKVFVKKRISEIQLEVV